MSSNFVVYIHVNTGLIAFSTRQNIINLKLKQTIKNNFKYVTLYFYQYQLPLLLPLNFVKDNNVNKKLFFLTHIKNIK